MTDSPPAPDPRPDPGPDATPTEQERARWQAAMALFDALQDLPPAERDARLRAAPPTDEVLAMLRRMFAAIGETCVLDRPLHALGDAAPDGGATGSEADAQADVSALAGRRFGRWLLLQPLGSGGMSTVWRARSVAPPVGQIAALKLLRLGAADAAGRARFAREIRILAALRHPGIAAIHDAGHTEDGTPWFTMALVEGETIDAWCERRAADVETRVALVRQAADAAAHAHRHLVVHRDIKPGNVMVDEAGRVSLLDFGISRLLEPPDEDADGGASAPNADATARTYAFTPRYAAPEQLRGDAQTTATDVYGLGALLHQLLLGVPPQWADGAGACRDPSAVGRATRDAGLRAQLRGDLGAILRKALEARPEDRYAGAAELADDLAAWRDGRPVRAHAGGVGYRLRRWAGRHRLAVGLGTAAVLALALGIGSTLWQRAQALEAAQRAEIVQQFLLDLFAEADTETRGERAPDLPAVLRTASARARADYTTQPALQSELLRTVGRLQHLNADHAAAVETLGAALALDAARDVAWDEARRRAVIAYASSLRRDGDGKASARAIDEWLAVDPPAAPITGPHCRGVLGATYADARARRQASEAVRDGCLALPPGDADRLFFAARLVENRRADGDGPGALALAEAEDAATAALPSLPPRAWDDWVALKAALAQAYKQARRPREAEAAAAAAVALAERHVGADSAFLIGPLRTQSTLLADLGRSADARAALARAIVLNGDDDSPRVRSEAVGLRMNLGRLAYDDGAYREAIAAWREALALAGEGTSADVGNLHANLAAAHDALGEYAEAAAAAQRALDHFATHFPAREDALILPGYHLCLAQASLGDARGLEACAQAMARERAGAPGDTLLRIEGDQYVADALTRLRAWPRALAAADAVIAELRAQPGHDTGAAAAVLARARFHRIEALAGLGRAAEAAAEFAALGDARCMDEALAERARAALQRSGASRVECEAGQDSGR